MLVVTDTSVILNLCFLGIEKILPALFGEIWSTSVVRDEFDRLALVDERFHGLKFPAYVRLRTPAHAPHDPPNMPTLDAGEISALALALELGANRILMDEHEGRLSARSLGLVPVGVLGVLILAKKKAAVSEIAPLLRRLKNDARFWISDSLYRSILASAGEITDT